MWPSLAREAPAPERMTVGGFRPGQVAHKLEQHSGPSTLKRRPCQELLWGSSVRQIPREWQGPRELLAPCGWSPQPPAQLGSPTTVRPRPQGPASGGSTVMGAHYSAPPPLDRHTYSVVGGPAFGGSSVLPSVSDPMPGALTSPSLLISVTHPRSQGRKPASGVPSLYL